MLLKIKVLESIVSNFLTNTFCGQRHSSERKENIAEWFSESFVQILGKFWV